MTKQALPQIKYLYRVKEVCWLLSFGKDKIKDLVESGELIAHCENGIHKKPLRIIGTSVVEYASRHKIDPGAWGV